MAEAIVENDEPVSRGPVGKTRRTAVEVCRRRILERPLYDVRVADEAYDTLAEIHERIKLFFQTAYRWVQAGESTAYIPRQRVAQCWMLPPALVGSRKASRRWKGSRA